MKNILNLTILKKRKLISNYNYHDEIKDRKRTRSHKRYCIHRLQIKKKNKKQKDNLNISRYTKRKLSSFIIENTLSSSSSSLTSTLLSSQSSNEKCWLPTHKWHSKRFHMKNIWGYRLPIHSNSYGIKYICKKFKDSQIIHDMSYYQPFELTGNIQNIIDLLSHFTDPSANWSDSLFLQGQKEKEFCLYNYDTFPQQCIGPSRIIIFHQKNNIITNENSDNLVQVWIWLHPGIFQDFFSIIENILNNSTTLQILLKSKIGLFSRFTITGINCHKLLSNVIYPVYSSKNNENNLSLYEQNMDQNGEFLKNILECDGINKIWPHGGILNIQTLDCRELSFSKLGITSAKYSNIDQNLFIKTSSSSSSNNNTNANDNDNNTTSSIQSSIPKKKNSNKRLHWPNKSAFMIEIDSNTRLLPNHEFNKRRHQEKFENWTISNEFSNDEKWTLPSSSSSSSSSTKINTPTTPKISSSLSSISTNIAPKTPSLITPNFKINNDNSNNNNNQFSLPIMIIRNNLSSIPEEFPSIPPTSQKISKHFNSITWDLIVPIEYSSIIWMSLVYGGGCPVGVEELSSIHLSLQIPSFPKDYPDTKLGKKYWEMKSNEVNTLIQKRPKRKKLLSSKYTIPKLSSIFQQSSNKSNNNNNNNTIQDEELNDVNFVIIRNVDYLTPFIPKSILNMKTNFLHKCDSKLLIKDNENKKIVLDNISLPFLTIIKIRLRSTGRGVPEPGASLYTPNYEDYKHWIECNTNRNKKTISHGRKTSDWWGIHTNINKSMNNNDNHDSNNDTKDRKLIGYLTSTLNTNYSYNLRIGIGFCEAKLLRELLYNAVEQVSGEARMLLLYQNNNSQWLRPGLFEIEPY